MSRDVDSKVGDFYPFAIETIQMVGREALKFYGKGRQRPPFDQDLVTEAELIVNDVFQEHIRQRYNDHLIFGVDRLDEGYTHEASRFLWIFDPLDGVDNFQSGIPIWGMSLALYENYWPILGLFYMPATNDLFRGAAGDKAYWNDRTIQITGHVPISQESLLLTFSRFNQHYTSTFPGKIRNLGSIGAHACYVAMGRADAAMTARESFRDLAAVRVIIECAGGGIYRADGSDFYLEDYLEGQRIDEHLMIGARDRVKMVVECLQRH